MLALSLLVGPVASVSAHEAGDNSCDITHFCAWEHSHYSGARGQWAGTNPQWSVFSKSTGGNWNDVASAGRNSGSTHAARIWEHTNYGGAGLCFPLGTWTAHLSDYSFNDIASSNDWRSSC